MTASTSAYTTEDLAREVYELVTDRLRLIGPDDPGRVHLMGLLPALGEALGAPRLRLVDRES